MKFSAPFGSHEEIINRFNLLLTLSNAKISNLERRIHPECLQVHVSVYFLVFILYYFSVTLTFNFSLCNTLQLYVSPASCKYCSINILILILVSPVYLQKSILARPAETQSIFYSFTASGFRIHSHHRIRRIAPTINLILLILISHTNVNKDSK